MTLRLVERGESVVRPRSVLPSESRHALGVAKSRPESESREGSEDVVGRIGEDTNGLSEVDEIRGSAGGSRCRWIRSSMEGERGCRSHGELLAVVDDDWGKSASSGDGELDVPRGILLELRSGVRRFFR